MTKVQRCYSCHPDARYAQAFLDPKDLCATCRERAGIRPPEPRPSYGSKELASAIGSFVFWAEKGRSIEKRADLQRAMDLLLDAEVLEDLEYTVLCEMMTNEDDEFYRTAFDLDKEVDTVRVAFVSGITKVQRFLELGP